MLVNAPLPDGDTGVMCDSTGHDGFGSFDNTLVLWGGGNPGPSCEDKKGKRMKKRKQPTQNLLLEKNNTKKTKKKTNTFLEKLISVEMTCC